VVNFVVKSTNDWDPLHGVARLGGRRSRGKNINWESCLICHCQESKGGSEHPHKATEEGLPRFKEYVNKGLKYHDTEYVNVLDNNTKQYRQQILENTKIIFFDTTWKLYLN